MSTKYEQLAELLKDDTLAKELFSLQSPEEAQKWISSHSIDMTLDEVVTMGDMIKKVLSEHSPEELKSIAADTDIELNDSELEMVSGGIVTAAGLLLGAAALGALGGLLSRWLDSIRW